MEFAAKHLQANPRKFMNLADHKSNGAVQGL